MYGVTSVSVDFERSIDPFLLEESRERFGGFCTAVEFECNPRPILFRQKVNMFRGFASSDRLNERVATGIRRELVRQTRSGGESPIVRRGHDVHGEWRIFNCIWPHTIYMATRWRPSQDKNKAMSCSSLTVVLYLE